MLGNTPRATFPSSLPSTSSEPSTSFQPSTSSRSEEYPLRKRAKILPELVDLDSDEETIHGDESDWEVERQLSEVVVMDSDDDTVSKNRSASDIENPIFEEIVKLVPKVTELLVRKLFRIAQINIFLPRIKAFSSSEKFRFSRNGRGYNQLFNIYIFMVYFL